MNKNSTESSLEISFSGFKTTPEETEQYITSKIVNALSRIAKQRYYLLIDQFSTGKITVTDPINSQQENNVANQSYIRSLRKYWENYYELTVFVK